MTKGMDDIDPEAQRVLGRSHGNDLAVRLAIQAIINRLAAHAQNGAAFRRGILDEARAGVRGAFGPDLPAAFLDGVREQGEVVLKSMLAQTSPRAPLN